MDQQPINREDTEAVTELSRLSTPVISDALDRLGQGPRGLRGLRSWGFDGGTIVGPAFTVTYRERGPDGGTVGDYIDDVRPGSVVVITNRGRTDCTVWGDLLTRRSHLAGLAFTVIDGAFRDVEAARSLGYPIFAREAFMVTGKDRVELEATAAAITVGHVTVAPGDLVCADLSGVVVVPARLARLVGEIGAQIADAEARIVDLIGRGERLDRARSDVGYHQLQRDGGGDA